MSVHLIGCAGAIEEVRGSLKLALLAFADSADDRTHIAFPGYPGVRKWAVCSRSRAAELIAELVEAGLIELHRTARPGRRAEYIVFPKGCCDLHRLPAVEPDDVDLEALAAAVGVSQDQVRELLALATQHDDMPADTGVDTPDPADTTNGSEISDPLRGDVSENSDPFATDNSSDDERVRDLGQRVRVLGLEHTNESTNGSENLDPFTTSNTNPVVPEPCPKHSPTVGANCRACGTSPRQVAAAADRAAAAQRRQEQAAAAAADRAVARPGVDPGIVQRVRQELAAAKGGRP